jgi:two-component system, LuxR family, response regulator FixJ
MRFQVKARAIMDTLKVTLVVIDGDHKSRKSVAALAASLKIPCETFISAQAFLDHCDPSLTGCALVDLQLGGMDVLELQDRLKSLRSTLAVVLISAQADMSLVVRALRRGAVAFLEKPYKNNELADAIRIAMEHSANVRKSAARPMEQQDNQGNSRAILGDMGKVCSSAQLSPSILREQK